jgi:sterol desaturase/sphingolipid hydroxylase (fatty acid hydroxylase superfamily)
LRRAVAPALLIVAGAPLDAVAIGGGVFTAWAVLNHSNLRFGSGVLETVLVTPRFHRAHHVPETSDRNLGTILTIWDRMRGTTAPGVSEPTAVFGVPQEVHTYPQTWLRQLFEPMRRIVGRGGRLEVGELASRWT